MTNFEVKWTANNELIHTDVVESLNMSGAEAQVRSKRDDIPGFRIIGVYAINVRESLDWESYTPTTQNNTPIAEDSVSAGVAGIGFVIGIGAFIVGCFMMPVGILAWIIGGLIGWSSWKLADWLNDRGW